MAAVRLQGRDAHPVKPGLLAWQELYRNGLVSISDPEIILSEKGYELGSLTPLGFRFLRFVGERKKIPDPPTNLVLMLWSVLLTPEGRHSSSSHFVVDQMRHRADSSGRPVC